MTDFHPLQPSWSSQLEVHSENSPQPQLYLSFRKGDIIDFVGTTHDTTLGEFSQEEWYVGKLEDSIGLLPRSCVVSPPFLRPTQSRGSVKALELICFFFSFCGC